MDPFDQASEQERLIREAAVSFHSIPQGPRPVFNAGGKPVCLLDGCGRTLKKDLRWCDADCRDAWQELQTANARNGRKAA